MEPNGSINIVGYFDDMRLVEVMILRTDDFECLFRSRERARRHSTNHAEWNEHPEKEIEGTDIFNHFSNHQW